MFALPAVESPKMIVEWVPVTNDGYQEGIVGQIVDVEGLGEGKVGAPKRMGMYTERLIHGSTGVII
eukprot:SAG31_NODE_1336_length_8738_cov_4.855655_4_plen_66_part_00